MKNMKRIALVVLAAWITASPSYAGNFVAHLDQTGNIPVATVATNSTGQAVIKNPQGAELSYKVLVAGLQNAVAAHIHCGAAGVAAPIGVTLFLSAPIDVNGILAAGDIAAPNADNACGWFDNYDVIDAINAGGAYINVHTLQNLPGEIRGQLE